MTSSVSIRRRVQWIDTDAAGIWHHSTVARWAEEAEAELHRQLGIIDQTFGATPRVVVEFEFRSPLRFDDVVDVTITVAKLGRSSITYLIEVRKGETVAASGRMVAVFIDRESGRKRPWPEQIRRALAP
ncbi:MAG: acyl-CoA thioesterase [Acidobacteria bacterium]|nr:MAG: acyl-CoA thioesterase [Acidobacteriota bacterium]